MQQQRRGGEDLIITVLISVLVLILVDISRCEVGGE